jgi:type IV pilus assembly protein PilB
LCARCKAPNKEILPLALEKVGFPKQDIEKTTFYRPVGCIHCVNGYKGRTAVHEVLYFSKEIRQLIMEAGASINEEAIRTLAVKQGMKTLREAGLDLVKEGVSTLEEIASIASDDDL